MSAAADPQHEEEEDYDAALPQSGGPPQPQPQQRIDDDDDELTDLARAQVAAMEQANGNPNATNGNHNNMEQQQQQPAIMDESGGLVQQRFQQFLQEFSEEVELSEEDNDPDEHDDDDDQQQRLARIIYPYADQASSMAKRQLSRRSVQMVDDDDDDNDTMNHNKLSAFSNTLVLNFVHVMEHDMELAEALQTEFLRFEPFLRQAIQAFVHDLHPELVDANNQADGSTNANAGGSNNGGSGSTCTFFLAVTNVPGRSAVRDIRTHRIGQLVTLGGTVTRTSTVRPELLTGSFRCLSCGLMAANIRQQFHYTRPTMCRNPRCTNNAKHSPLQFALDARQSEFCDWQKLRVQEHADEIPPGSMPRSLDVMVRNEMVERCKAGDACVFVGSLVVLPDGSALARAGEAPRAVQQSSDATARGGGGGVRGLAALGVRELTYRTCFVATCVLQLDQTHSASTNPTAALLYGSANNNNNNKNTNELTPEQVVLEMTRAERDEIREMKSSPRLYQQLVESLCPRTFGHAEVKKGILLMLLGGVHKTTPDGIQLRGDLNVCVVGDPSTAKSQFLKFVHEFWQPNTVYTSGKASSAAGLTAAVQRDPDTGEYGIEAGALLLADQGICCIDEFDKMDPTDQVAIHEAMEQQTISITKAGIQATLNARASILAAANPIYGRYDRTKTLRANVALSAPILSRFDLFFVVLDECNPDADRHVAEHILKVHRCQEDAVKVPFGRDQMRRYIRFARTINPQISPASQRVLVDCYRKLRQGDTLGRSRSAYRITVRQLESMIRLSEALARLHCDPEIQPEYVREAFRLLRTSIIQVETSNVEMDEDEDDEDEEMADGGDDDDDDDNNNNGNSDNPETQDGEGFETQAAATVHPGEYGTETGSAPPASATAESTAAAAATKKKKTKISYEEYESIANAMATHLRSLEADEGSSAETKYLTWSQLLNWYLEQVEQDIGDSVENLKAMRKKLNLVLRRLVHTDHILVPVGGSTAPATKKEEQQTVLAVHPNYVTS